MKKLWYTPDLQLFASEGAENSNGETGVEDAVAGQTGAENREDEFSELINGKFKEQFRKRTQSIIDKRFKETKQLEEFKNLVSPLMAKLNDKYNNENGDIKRVEELSPRLIKKL